MMVRSLFLFIPAKKDIQHTKTGKMKKTWNLFFTFVIVLRPVCRDPKLTRDARREND